MNPPFRIKIICKCVRFNIIDHISHQVWETLGHSLLRACFVFW